VSPKLIYWVILTVRFPDERHEQIFEAALRTYHSEKITNNGQIAQRIKPEYGIETRWIPMFSSVHGT
jgi:replicative DNA helicase